MLHFVIGPPKSGKSEYAEQLINRYSTPTIYIGTLPSSLYEEEIRIHQERRPPTWSLLELTGNPQTDINAAEAALRDFQNVLIDGITCYLLRLMTIFKISMDAFRGHFISLVDQAAQKIGEVIIVDPPVPPLPYSLEQIVLRDMHNTVARRAYVTTFVNSGLIKQISRSELIRIDRGGRLKGIYHA